MHSLLFRFSAINLSAIDKLHHFGAELVKLASVPVLGIGAPWFSDTSRLALGTWAALTLLMRCRASLSAGALCLLQCWLTPCLWNTDVPLEWRVRAGADLSKSWLDVPQVSSLNLQAATGHREKICTFKHYFQFHILVLHKETTPGQLGLLK